jgi:hypothetical protein
MIPPYVGALAPEWTFGRCAYSPTEADLACMADSVWHGICVDGHGRIAEGLECCEKHKPIMQILAAYIHPIETPCGLPDAIFIPSENRCALPWDEHFLTAHEELQGAAS